MAVSPREIYQEYQFKQNPTSVNNPTTDDELVRKGYVDGLIEGLDVKESVKLATTTDLNANTSVTVTAGSYVNNAGAAGRGQITGTLAVSDTFTVDGVSLGAADDGTRILIKNEATGNFTDGAEANGIWVTTISGTSLTLDRAEDFDEDSEVTANAFTFVEEGTANADSGWTLTTDDPIVIGGASGTALTFSQFSGAGSITAGEGLTKTGNTLDLDFNDLSNTLTTGLASTDLMSWYDGSDTGNEQKKMTLGNFLTDIAGSGLSVNTDELTVDTSGQTYTTSVTTDNSGTYTITHNMGLTTPFSCHVTVYNNSTGAEVETSVNARTTNSVDIGFDPDPNGTVFDVIVSI
jgi:hypothetical protein